MTDFSRREILKLSASIPLLPYVSLDKNYEIVYKVVSYYNGDYISTSTSEPFRLRYKLNEWTYPKIGKIFCYNKLESAKHYRGSIGPLKHRKIFKCLADNVVLADYIADDAYSPEDFWINGTGTAKPSVVYPHFPEPYFCDKLIPLQEC